MITSFFVLSTACYAQGSEVKIKENNKATPADILSSIENPIKKEGPPLAKLFTGSAELGVLYKTGNTNSGDLKTGFDLRIEKGQWLSLLNFDLLIKKADIKNSDTDEVHFETTDEKWSIASQTNYKINNSEKNYVYLNLWYEDNNFNSFTSQSSVSSGWGRHWYQTDKASLWADIGPGYKKDIIKATDTEVEKVEDSIIIQAQTLYIRQLGENVEFKQYFSMKYAIKKNENSLYKAETSITTKLISTLQLKFTFTVDYNSLVEENKKNTDTQTAMTLVYSF
jgi:putative salt-induced outer membrane protein YdiY